MQKQSGFAVLEALLIIIVLALIGGTGYYVWHSKQQTEKLQHSSVQAASGVTSQTARDCGAGARAVDSGKGKFSLCFTNGWVITRDAQTDFMIMTGQKQPVSESARPVEVRTVPVYGSDSPSVFAIFTEDKNPCPDLCQGRSAGFKLQNGIEGKRYTYEYSRTDDQTDGLGARTAGDLDYTYVFRLADGQYLRAWYSVYAADPVDRSGMVDDMIAAIAIKQ